MCAPIISIRTRVLERLRSQDSKLAGKGSGYEPHAAPRCHVGAEADLALRLLESSKVSTTPLLIGAGRLSCMMSELTQRVPLMARH